MKEFIKIHETIIRVADIKQIEFYANIIYIEFAQDNRHTLKFDYKRNKNDYASDKERLESVLLGD